MVALVVGLVVVPLQLVVPFVGLEVEPVPRLVLLVVVPLLVLVVELELERPLVAVLVVGLDSEPPLVLVGVVQPVVLKYY